MAPSKAGLAQGKCGRATIKLDGHGGGGAAVRDHYGKFLARTCHFPPSVMETELAELLACRRVVQLASDVVAQRL